jgi:hypothetical protein
MDGSERRIILIDEPDAHIHPDLQVRFADFLIQAASRYKLQVVVATHSTSLLAALGQFGATSASVIYLDRARSEFRAQSFNEAMKELAACLGGHALMGPLFGVPMLLVEGDDDYRIWSQVPRHHVTSFAVIPSNGDEMQHYQKALEKMFGSLRETPATISGFALLDGDKALPTPNDSTPQNHIRYIGLACHEAENLYFTDEVLVLMGTDWTTAVATIHAAADSHGTKAGELRALTVDTDRRTADLKSVIHAVADILDPKRLHWTIRVSQVIGPARPAGQLLEFLSPTVVDSLWGPLVDPHSQEVNNFHEA